jgi:hypothetical protein
MPGLNFSGVSTIKEVHPRDFLLITLPSKVLSLEYKGWPVIRTNPSAQEKRDCPIELISASRNEKESQRIAEDKM